MDETFDWVVIGSGAGSFASALVMRAAGKSVLVLEKTPLVGGTTAKSGGVMWIPGNRFMAEDGEPDSLAAADHLSRCAASARRQSRAWIDTRKARRLPHPRAPDDRFSAGAGHQIAAWPRLLARLLRRAARRLQNHPHRGGRAVQPQGTGRMGANASPRFRPVQRALGRRDGGGPCAHQSAREENSRADRAAHDSGQAAGPRLHHGRRGASGADAQGGAGGRGGGADRQPGQPRSDRAWPRGRRALERQAHRRGARRAGQRGRLCQKSGDARSLCAGHPRRMVASARRRYRGDDCRAGARGRRAGADGPVGRLPVHARARLGQRLCRPRCPDR